MGNSTVPRGIWDKYREWYFKIHQNITSRRGGEWYLESFEISRAGIYSKYPEETLLLPVYTSMQRNFALYVTGVIFTCKYYQLGLSTTGLSQSHFRNLSACSINGVIARVISKSDEREERGRCEITSAITPWIVRHEVQLLINRNYNKIREEHDSRINYLTGWYTAFNF